MNPWGIAWGDSWGSSWGPLHVVDDLPPSSGMMRLRRKSGDGFRKPVAPVLDPIEDEEALLLCLL